MIHLASLLCATPAEQFDQLYESIEQVIGLVISCSRAVHSTPVHLTAAHLTAAHLTSHSSTPHSTPVHLTAAHLTAAHLTLQRALSSTRRSSTSYITVGTQPHTSPSRWRSTVCCTAWAQPGSMQLLHMASLRRTMYKSIQGSHMPVFKLRSKP